MLSLLSKSYPTASVKEIKHDKFNNETIKTILEQASVVMNKISLNGSYRFTRQIVADIDKTLVTRLSDNINKLLKILQEELSEQCCMYLPKESAKWFNNVQYFGENVIDAFPSASDDIIEAGNCYALDRPTACVFHCMRILEYGLKALADNVGRTFDAQNWQNIIEEIESEIMKMKKMKNSKEKSERLQFLSEAAKEFTYFKDGWRNHVSHNRLKYDLPQAHSALNHVRSFMQQLSKELKEI